VYDLIIFDLDGTLIDSIGDIADALNAALAELGLPPHPDAAVVRMVGSGVEALARRALPAALHGRVGELIPRYRAHYQERLLGRTSLYLGVAPTLAALDRVAKAVATNKPGGPSREILAALGIAQHFVAVLGADDVERVKPDPLIVDLLRGKVGAERKRTLFVGDSLVDAATADAAGVDLCLVTYGYADPQAIAAAPARYHIDRFSELLPILR
jgi:phosphoglycolate phosphatase